MACAASSFLGCSVGRIWPYAPLWGLRDSGSIADNASQTTKRENVGDTRKGIDDNMVISMSGVVITMRIYAEPDDQMLKEINRKAKETGIGKSQFVLEALDQYLHGSDQSELVSAKADLAKAREDLEKRWSEITTLRTEITALKADLEKSRSACNQLAIKNDQIKEHADQVSGELEGVKRDHQHFKDTIDHRDKQISFLEGHIAQLTQSISQLSLKPGEEEIKKKGWWHFWK